MHVIHWWTVVTIPPGSPDRPLIPFIPACPFWPYSPYKQLITHTQLYIKIATITVNYPLSSLPNEPICSIYSIIIISAWHALYDSASCNMRVHAHTRRSVLYNIQACPDFHWFPCLLSVLSFHPILVLPTVNTMQWTCTHMRTST